MITRALPVLLLFVFGAVCLPAAQPPLMFKEFSAGEGVVSLTGAHIVSAPELSSEAEQLTEALAERGVAVSATGIEVRLEVGEVVLPVRESRYRDELVAQGFELSASGAGVTIRANTASGIFNGGQALVRALNADHGLPMMMARDWPDIPVRMIMVDPARQNENFEYYRRVIRFCARYRINAILIHLTDDQTSCLYNPAYPELMHAHAWKQDEIRDLVAYAGRHHIELIPEIESFGHSRMFTRRADFKDYLHQDAKNKPTTTWYGTDIPGYTNVLCPASEKTYEYLDSMYASATAAFDSPVLHLGFDEVDMTKCGRCEAKFPGITREEWFRRHLVRCRELAEKHGKRAAFWGDMLIAHPEIMDGFAAGDSIIHDWHYRPDVTADSAVMFLKRGFEVIGAPSLVCAPHMVLPDSHDYENIRRFAAIAREHDLRGLNTTVWVPQRYMSDALWPGLAFAGAQSWGGSNFEDARFHALIARDLYGIEDGEAFGRVWTGISAVVGHLDEFNLCAFADDESLAKSRAAPAERVAQLVQKRELLRPLLREMEGLGGTVTRNDGDWHTLERSARIVAYLLRRFEAAAGNTLEQRRTLARLDRECVRIIGWIEEDWDRNRYADDPNKDGIHLPAQHLLQRFKQMHAYHKVLEGRVADH